MPYLVATDLSSAPAGARFRALLAAGGIVQIPGAHNGLAALLARAAGFPAVYLSGAAMSASMGLPDLGVITVDDVSFFVRQVARASGLPLLVDGDTGYGEALNVMHMVRSFEDAGAAAVHIEDQLLPKKCGHLNDKKLADPHDMAAKVAAAAKARRHLYLIARTDAAASEGMDGAVARARLYLQAGADAIFPEALISAEMFREFARRVDAPLLANMTEFGRTPFFTAAEFAAMGYRMVIWPVSSLRVAAKAQGELYAAIRRDGGAQNMLDRMQTRAELYETIGYADYEALDASIVQTVVPQGTAQDASPADRDARFELVTSEEEIRAAFHRFKATMERATTLYPTHSIGFQGESRQLDVRWNPRLGIWSHFGSLENRYWCVFGVQDPERTPMLSITVEVNTPHRGVDLRIAGAFVRDEEGNFCVAHSGRVGGGRKGIGKSAFTDFYQSGWQEVSSPDIEPRQMIVLGRADSPDLPDSIARFVREVDRFKREAVASA